jgi:multidrug efflux pump subunit AcrA (membrane-fusion protein)
MSGSFNGKESGASTLLKLSLVLVSAVVIGCAHPPPADETATEDIPPVPVQAAIAQLTMLKPSIEVLGSIVAIPEQTASVSPQVGGWIERVSVVDGAEVHKGDELVQLDTRVAQIEVSRATAAVREKEAALARLRSGYLPNELEVARHDRDKAKVALDSLRSQLAAIEDLRKRNEISQVQYETHVAAVQGAEKAFASADAHAKLIEQGTRPELIAEAEAQLEIAKSAQSNAQLALDLCRIVSPIDGVVVHLTARQGQFIERATPLTTVIDLSRVFAQVRVPGAAFAHVTPGTKADVMISDLAGGEYHGEIIRLSEQADPMTGNVDAFISLINEGHVLRPGLACSAVLWLPEIPNAIVIPPSAVADRDGATVVTVVRDGKAYEVAVKLGTLTRDAVQVLEGINPKDVVVTSGGYGLPDGCPVKVVSDAIARRP